MSFVRLIESRVKFTEDVVRRGSPEPILVLEVIGDQRMVNAGALRNIARRGALEAILGECLDCRVEKFLLRYQRALLLLPCRLDPRNMGVFHG